MLRRLLPTGIVGDRHGPYLALTPSTSTGPSYGGLVGPTLDAARFAGMHLRDGELDGSRILAADTARRMRAIERPGKQVDHGIGWFRRPRIAESWVEHFGAALGSGT